jgi:hypothetical protein
MNEESLPMSHTHSVHQEILALLREVTILCRHLHDFTIVSLSH